MKRKAAEREAADKDAALAQMDAPSAALIKAAQSARFNRRMRGAAAASAFGPAEQLQEGTLQRFEAEAAMLLWAEVQNAYPPLGGLTCEELAGRYLALSEEERRLDETTSALEGVSMMIGGGVNRKYEPPARVAAAQAGSGTSGELTGSSLSAGVAPLLALVAATAAFYSFSGNACNHPEPGSAIARGCAEQEEVARTGVRPENDLEKLRNRLREDTARKLEAWK